MTRPLLWTAAVGAVVITSLACEGDAIGMGDGSIDIHNADDAAVTLLISDSADCGLGMHSSLEAGSTRNFSVGESSFVCVGEHPPGLAVEDGGTYRIEGGAMVSE